MADTFPIHPFGVAIFSCAIETIRSFLAHHGLGQYCGVLSVWLFFAGCGVLELGVSFTVCTPLERLWPLTSWPERNPIGADVAYAFFARIVLFPLIAFFEYDWLRGNLDAFLRSHSLGPLSLAVSIPILGAWPVVVFVANFAMLDLADYWRHRISHRVGWWYGLHSLHHAEEQMTFWSDDRSHILEDAITYVWLIAIGLVIGVPAFQFPFLILCFRFLGSVSHANTRVRYRWFGERVLISPQFHRTHHALRAAGRRSCNFGTALPWWDILFGTARFGDNTVETGDAGAERALASGSWGEQQRAGVRRMIRLARRQRRVTTARAAS